MLFRLSQTQIELWFQTPVAIERISENNDEPRLYVLLLVTAKYPELENFRYSCCCRSDCLRGDKILLIDWNLWDSPLGNPFHSFYCSRLQMILSKEI